MRNIVIPAALAVDLKIACRHRLDEVERQLGSLDGAAPGSHVAVIRDLLAAAEAIMLGRNHPLVKEKR